MDRRQDKWTRPTFTARLDGTLDRDNHLQPAPRGRALRLLALAGLLGASLLSGCAVQPWVKPYERGRLADPEMQWSRQGLIDKHREHVHVVREAARGATGVQGGGCGCN